jgi:CRISPR-associated protein Cpf1
MKNFINLYQLSKTLRFELIPQGKTKENIETKGLLKKDKDRAESYQLMKKTIDGFHKHFIELAMSQVNLTHLQKFEELYNTSSERKKEDAYKKELEKVQTELRKEIVKGFNSDAAKYYYWKKLDLDKTNKAWLKFVQQKQPQLA